jgi:hypothetical protein
MKARFHFICNNKMKADFRFIKSAKGFRAPRAVESLHAHMGCGGVIS